MSDDAQQDNQQQSAPAPLEGAGRVGVRQTRTFEQEREVAISDVQGRPMLHWRGKRPLPTIYARPAQLTDTFSAGDQPTNPQLWADWPTTLPHAGLLFYGDNKDTLATLLATGLRDKVRLIYIDPPFASGADYVRNVQLRGVSGLSQLEGEAQSLIEQKQYTDIWTNDLYLQFMYERLILLKELLTKDGSIWVHCDPSMNSYLRILLDEIYTKEHFVNEIIWSYSTQGRPTERFAPKHDSILWYERADKHFFNAAAAKVDHTPEYIGSHFNDVDDEGRPCRIRVDAGKRRIYYPDDGMIPNDVWDIPYENPMALSRTDYPTQKPEELLERIILAASEPGDIILDCFSGSGTTAAVAQKFGRRWVAVDLNRGAIQTTSRRLQQIIKEQAAQASQPQQADLGNVPPSNSGNGRKGKRKANGNPPPAQLGFSTYRVNNYLLNIPYVEAIDLALKSVGAKRLSGDLFFNGTRGDKLVKVVALDHPLGPLDLEAVKRELELRSGEARSIVVVCYGRLQATEKWLKEWNEFRAVAKLDEDSGTAIEFVNKIEVIDLEDDPRYGGFLDEQPPIAEATIRREGEQVVVTISGFDSPTIVRRLNMDITIFRAVVSDWRSLVNSVELDLSYDGTVFDIDYSELPVRKNDLVQGNTPNPPAGSIIYRLPAPATPTRVALRITDMLGQEAPLIEAEI